MPEEQPWELEVKIVPVTQLREMPGNARSHGPRSIEAIKKSFIVSKGQRKPIVVANDEVTVIAGNGQLIAARELGWEFMAIAVAPFPPGSPQAITYALNDNRTGDLSEFDRDSLADSFRELDEELRKSLAWEPEEFNAILPPVSPNAGAAAAIGAAAANQGSGSGSDPASGSEGSAPESGGPESSGSQVAGATPSEGYQTIMLTAPEEEARSIRTRLGNLKREWGCDQLGEVVLRLLDEHDAMTGDSSAGG